MFEPVVQALATGGIASSGHELGSACLMVGNAADVLGGAGLVLAAAADVLGNADRVIHSSDVLGIAKCRFELVG